MFNGKLLCQMSTKGLYTIALGGVVPGGEIMDSVLACDVHGGLGYLTADKGVQAMSGSGFQVRLSGPGTPAQPLQRLPACSNPLRGTSQRLLDTLSERGTAERLHQRSVAGQFRPTPVTETSVLCQIQPLRELRVVTQFGVGIEWQVVRKQADIMTQQRLDTALLHTRETIIFALPEKTVVDQQQVSMLRYRCIDKRLAGGNPADDFVYRTPTLNLQTVRAIILESLRLQQVITVFNQFSQARQFQFSPPVYNATP